MLLNKSPSRSPQFGMSIVEMMVGMAVALLVTLAAAGTAIVFTAQQRQGIGTGGVSMNALNALATIKDEIALSGLGFFGDSAYRCSRLSFSEGSTTHMNNAVFTPVSITRDTTTGDDQIDTFYGNKVEAGTEVLLSGSLVNLTSPNSGSEVKLRTLLPVTSGDAVLLAKTDNSQPCVIRSVTAFVASTATSPQVLTFASTGTHNQAVFTPAPAFAADDRVTLLGSINWMRFRRSGDTVVAQSVLTGAEAVIARNVIGLRAEYGTSPDNTSTHLNSWEPAASAFAALDGALLRRVRAVRVGIVTRNPQREKPDSSGNCQASLVRPTIFGQTVNPDVTDWQCYRYSVVTAVIPMRNLVMGYR